MGVTTSKSNKAKQTLQTFLEFDILMIESNLDQKIIVNQLPIPQPTISAYNLKYPEDLPQIVNHPPLLQKRASRTKEPKQIVLTHQAKINQYKQKHQSLSTLSPLKGILKVSKSHDPFGFGSVACSPTSQSNLKKQISSERRKPKRYNLDEIF